MCAFNDKKSSGEFQGGQQWKMKVLPTTYSYLHALLLLSSIKRALMISFKFKSSSSSSCDVWWFFLYQWICAFSFFFLFNKLRNYLPTFQKKFIHSEVSELRKREREKENVCMSHVGSCLSCFFLLSLSLTLQLFFVCDLNRELILES